MTIRIRKAKESEHGLIYGMNKTCFVDSFKIYPSETWWIGFDEETNKPVCFVGAQEWFCGTRKDMERALYIPRMGVISKYRGLGLQKKLIQLVCKEAKNLGLDEVWALTSHQNIHSMNNFIKCGFVTWLPWSWAGDREPWKPQSDYGWVFWRKSVL